LAAKKPGAKPAAKSVKNSKTVTAKSHFTSRQRQSYQAALKGALKNANREAKASSIANSRLQAALTRQRRRNRYVQRTQAKIVRNTYLQARYGVQNYSNAGIPLRSRLATAKAVSEYLQVRYGKKTYSLTTTKGSVRIKPRVQRGQVVAAGKRALTKSSTGRNRTAQAVANRVARRTSAQAPPSRRRTAPRNLRNADGTRWVTAGNDEGTENCTAVAIANSCLYSLGYKPSDEQVAMIKGGRLSVALWLLHRDSTWWPAELFRYRRVNLAVSIPLPGDIVGFETENGSHCGLLLPGGKVVSWGETVSLETEIDEAWTPVWKITG